MTKEVSDIKEARKKKNAERKLAQQELFLAVANAINRDEFALLPAFFRRYYVIEPSFGNRMILVDRNGNGVVEYCEINAVTADIVRYTEALNNDLYRWVAHTCAMCADYWLKITTPITIPKILTFANSDALTFRRLPWDTATLDSADTPLFNELFSRMSNAQAVKQWIGSLFDLNSDCQQYVWLYSEGGTGKGALSRFLAKVFGQAYSSENVPDHSDKFWTINLINKRVVVFNDCNNYSFPNSGLFKSLTGGDLVRVEKKFSSSFTAKINAKFMFCSNERPTLSSELSDQRRVIYAEMDALSNAFDPKYEHKLWNEGGNFIKQCIEAWESVKSNGVIATDKEAIASWVNTMEERYEMVFRKHFAIADSAYTMPVKFQELLSIDLRKNTDKINFIKYIERTYGIKKKGIKRDGKTIYIYPGIKPIFASLGLDTCNAT